MVLGTSTNIQQILSSSADYTITKLFTTARILRRIKEMYCTARFLTKMPTNTAKSTYSHGQLCHIENVARENSTRRI